MALLPAACWGQVVTATLYGTVLDPNGGGIPNARVTATNVDRGTAIVRETDGSGQVTLTSLPVGNYVISVEAPGFKSLRQSGIALSAGEDLRVDFKLELGQVAERIEVTAEAPLINTANAEQRTTLETLRVRELPTFRRDWTNLLNLSTGVQVTGGAVRLNGLAPASFRLTVDGTDATQDNELPSFAMSGNFNFIKGVATEAIAEVNLAKGIASAEIANTMSGNVNIITRSGTNAFHGSLFWLNNTENFNARLQFLRNKPNLVYNQYGGSFGGPFVKNRLFFFGAYEGYRQRGFQALNEQVPTREFREMVSARTSIYDKTLSVFPLPNQPYAVGVRTGAWIGSGTEQGKDDHAVVRVDYNVTGSNILSARYTRARPFRLMPRVVTANNRTWEGKVEQGTLNFTHARPAWTFETRFGYNYNHVPRIDNFFGLYDGDRQYNGITGLGFGVDAERLEREGYTWSIEQTVSRTIGRHALKFGGIYMEPHVRRDNEEAPRLTYSTVQDLYDNIPNAGRVTVGVSLYDMKTVTLGFFVQDDFRASQRLVVNMGIRYDYFSPPRERDNRLFNREQPFGTGPYRPGDDVWNRDLNNFSPRLGFAWTLTNSGRTVLRGGAGMFHSPIPMYAGGVDLVRNAIDEPFRVNYNRAEVLAVGNVFRWPVSNDAVRAFVKGRPTLIGDTAVNTNNPYPFSYQWHLGVQHELPGAVVLETGYVGTRGVNMQMVRFWNQVDRITGIRPYAGFTEFRYRDAGESSAFHSWQNSVRKRFSMGLALGANYTYASAYSYTGEADLALPNSVQDIYNVRADKGPPNDFVRHSFVSDFVYELPFARAAGVSSIGMRNLLAGWQIAGIFTARSGSPINVLQESAFEGSRADYIGGEPKLEDYRRTLRYLDRSRFALVPIGQTSGVPVRPGNVGRNALFNIGWWNLDASLAKRFFVTERVNAKLEAQMLNAFNHTNLSGIEARASRANFGQFTSTRGARVVQFNLRLDF
ncbi:MAG TPA: TonB-dependent receptor [Bryobacteraceae bacterium]|nr:TonB-dependent receptor [Bryobacteraceae bacterium]